MLRRGPMAGAIYETAVVSEIMKNRLAAGIKPGLFFWRSQSGLYYQSGSRRNLGILPGYEHSK